MITLHGTMRNLAFSLYDEHIGLPWKYKKKKQWLARVAILVGTEKYGI
jgi:hypothetical protein